MSEAQTDLVTGNKIAFENESKPRGSRKTGESFLTFMTCGLCPKGNKDPNKEPKKPKMHKNKEVKGEIKFETATNVPMFRNILDNSIIGTRLVAMGVICSKTSGGIIACNPPDFTPSVEQILHLLSGFEDTDKLKTEGFVIVKDSYEPFNFGPDEISGRTKGDGTYYEALIVQTNTAMIIGITTNPVDSIKEVMIEIRDRLKGQGF